MFLQVREPGSPVLLFLHGGPGMPEFWLTQRHPTRLHEAFTVAWWEQRGAGLSYHPDIPAETMTVEQFIDDTITVAQYLCQRFGVDKVHLMAHSWGSFIGLQAAARAPELFHTYIGMAQATHQIASEQEAYTFMLEAYRARGDQRMVRRLERSPVTGDIPLPRGYEVLRDPAMHRLGVGTTHDMGSVVTGIFLPSLASPDYTPAEKVNLWRGRRFSRSFGLWDQMLATDLTTVITRLADPRVLPARPPRPDRVLPAGEGLRRSARRAPGRLLHLRPLSPQPRVRGTRPHPADPHRGRPDRNHHLADPCLSDD